jgi:hypothetical protein
MKTASSAAAGWTDPAVFSGIRLEHLTIGKKMVSLHFCRHQAGTDSHVASYATISCPRYGDKEWVASEEKPLEENGREKGDAALLRYKRA